MAGEDLKTEELRRSELPLEAAPAEAEQETRLAAQEGRRYARIQSAALTLLAAGALLAMMWVAKSVLIVTLVSVLIAFMLAPIVELCSRMRMPRAAGAMVAVLVLCSGLYGVFYVSYSQANQFISELPQYSGNIRGVLNQVIARAERVRQTTRTVLPPERVDNNTVTVRESSNWVNDLTSGAIGVTHAVVMATFVPFLVFFMLSWQDHVRSSTVLLFGPENRDTAFVTLGLIAQMIRGFIVGNVIIGIILAVCSSVAFWLLGVPFPWLIGIISGFVSLLPYLGVVLAIAPPVMVSLGLLTTGKFVAIVVFVTVSHVIALNVLYPKIIGSRLQLNPLAVTLALLFWGWLWGAMGLLLAIPLTAAMKIIFDHVQSLRGWGAWLGE